VTLNYHNSWLKEKDDYIWSISGKHRDKDIETLLKITRREI